MRRVPRRALLVLVAVIVAAGLVVIGRVTASRAGSGDAVGRSNAYFAGLLAGQADGRRQGRALQEGVALPAGARRAVRQAFDAGYAAGANDAFAGYDGGWTMSVPYVVTLEPGSGAIVYRIASRTVLKPGVDYYLCPNGHGVCQRPSR